MKLCLAFVIMIVSGTYASGFPMSQNEKSKPTSDTLSTFPRKDRPVGIVASAFGPGFAGISLELFLCPALESNITVGYGISGGVNYHPFPGLRKTKFSPYIGIHATTFKSFETGIFGEKEAPTRIYGLYNPIGIQYFGMKGLTIGLEGALYTTFWKDGGTGPWLGLNIGYRFKFKK